MSKIKKENLSLSTITKTTKLSGDAKRCSLCHHCACNIRPYDMPQEPHLYYGGKDDYLVKRIDPTNTFYMCAGNEFGRQEPNVDSNNRQCWIGSKN
jgi:hypothetical protein